MQIEFVIPDIPVAQPRSRAVGVRIGDRVSARMHDAPSNHPIHAFKAACKLALRNAYAGPPLSGPVKLCLTFWMPKTSAQAKRKRDRDCPLRHTKRPDIDNLTKGVMDAMKGLAWRDDTQVCELHAIKWRGPVDLPPSVKVIIEEVI